MSSLGSSPCDSSIACSRDGAEREWIAVAALRLVLLAATLGVGNRVRASVSVVPEWCFEPGFLFAVAFRVEAESVTTGVGRSFTWPGRSVEEPLRWLGFGPL